MLLCLRIHEKKCVHSKIINLHIFIYLYVYIRVLYIRVYMYIYIYMDLLVDLCM